MSLAIAAALAVVACSSSNVSRSVGARCVTTHDCAERCLTPGPDFPDGFCTLSCTTNGDCPSDADCIDGEGGICLFHCLENRDCAFLGAGWTCQDTRLLEGGNTRVCLGG
jgi:hypothetical protein